MIKIRNITQIGTLLIELDVQVERWRMSPTQDCPSDANYSHLFVNFASL